MTEREHLSAMALDRLALGLGDREERAAALTHLDTCERCRTAQQQAARLRRQFEDRVCERTLPVVAKRAEQSAAWQGWPNMAKPMTWLVPGMAVAGAALVVLMWTPTDGHDVGDAVEPPWRVKGTVLVQAFARRQDSVFPIKNDGAIQAGDAIQFVVDGAGFSHLLVLGRDGTGAARTLYPTTGAKSIRLPKGKKPLGASFVVDATPGTEEFFLIFSGSPLDPSEPLAALARGERLSKLLATRAQTHVEVFRYRKARP